MKIKILTEYGWREIEDDELLFYRRGQKGWFPVHKSQQRPNKKIDGTWYRMGAKTEEC